MSLIAGCKLYVDEESMTVAYSLDSIRRLARPYIDKRQAVKVEIWITSGPNQIWHYEYGSGEWVLHS